MVLPGQWLVAEGVQIQYAEEVYRITPTASGKGISLLCPTRKILNRGNTLNLATLSIVRNVRLRMDLTEIRTNKFTSLNSVPGYRAGL